MRYLRRYTESNRLDSFIDDLTKELENIDFDLNYSYESDFLQIDKQGVGTFIYFDISDFSIESLKKECNDKLNDDKSDWSLCTDTIKDDYDLLCTTILVFIDEYENK